MSARADLEPPAYSGQSELMVLELATRYNDHIAHKLARVLAETCASAPDVLDFGAGIGTITRRFTELTGVRPRALELDAAQRAMLAAQGFTCHAALDEVAPASLDLVISSNVLEHIVDDVSTLLGIRERLRARGRVALWVPAFPLLWTPLDDRVGHVRRYTAETLSAALELAGFRVCSLEHQDSLGFVAALAFKLLGKASGELDPRAVRLYDRAVFPLSRRLDRLTSRYVGKNLFVTARPA